VARLSGSGEAFCGGGRVSAVCRVRRRNDAFGPSPKLAATLAIGRARKRPGEAQVDPAKSNNGERDANRRALAGLGCTPADYRGCVAAPISSYSARTSARYASTVPSLPDGRWSISGGGLPVGGGTCRCHELRPPMTQFFRQNIGILPWPSLTGATRHRRKGSATVRRCSGLRASRRRGRSPLRFSRPSAAPGVLDRG
jgi:hypothetical protein